LLEWVKNIIDNFCKEQAIDERTSYDSIKDHFHDDFHEIFLCTIPTLLFKFLIYKGLAHIVEPRPPLVEPRSDTDKKRVSRWKQFVEEQKWKQFVE
jgi:dihydrodipicolinate synthase/N-acetylneuraminate lyase